VGGQVTMAGTQKNPGRLVLGRDEYKPSVLVITLRDKKGRPRLATFLYPDDPVEPPIGEEYHVAYMIGRSMRRRR
jgi:hypothetical protein